MKPCIISLALMATLMPMADAETIWAEGVSYDSGWYDANKTKKDDPDWYDNYPNDPSGKGAKTDDNMCYAAAAANILAWWQDQYVIPSDTPKGVDQTSGTYTLDASDVWSTFVTNSLYGGGLNVPQAILWYMTGEAQYKSGEIYFATAEGYYSSTIPAGITLYEKNDTTGAYFIQNHAATAANILDILNSHKAAALELGGHSITLWGADVEDGSINSLFVTDSDDYTGTTDLMEVKLTTTADGKLTFKFNESDTETFTIGTIYTINPEVSDAWGMERVPSTGSDSTVPEPATATLSLLALAGLAMRRRRK